MTDRAAASYRTARELVTPQRLREFFAPRSIALVGASDNSGWARFIVASCATAGFSGPLTAVHPRAERAFALPMPGPGSAAGAAGPWSETPRSEMGARRLLAGAGVPVVPGGLAGSADEAVEIARRVGLPVALKVCSAQITHKSDIGGVLLGLGSEAEVRAGYEKVRAAGMAVPEASVDGVLVTPNSAPYGTLRALEVNPLWVNGDQVEALDVLVVTQPGTEQGR
jgi:acyl-CoA synthetase (NDP forming)